MWFFRNRPAEFAAILQQYQRISIATVLAVRHDVLCTMEKCYPSKKVTLRVIGVAFSFC